MKNKKFLCLTIFFICLFAISTVNASEVNDDVGCVVDKDFSESGINSISTDIGHHSSDSMYSNELDISNSLKGMPMESDDILPSLYSESNDVSKNRLANTNKDIVAAVANGTFADLKDLVSGKSNTTITLSRNYTNTASYSGGIIINGNNVVIRGSSDNIIIDAKSQGIFKITGNNVTISGITFKNAKSTNGSAIFWQGSNGYLNNCNFINCTGLNGGAIFWNSDMGRINKCYFENCSVRGDHCAGGAIYFNSSFGTIKYCIFNNCKSYAPGNYSWGGALYLNGKGIFTENSNFTKCTSSAYNGYDYGDAIYAYNVTDGGLRSCNFVNCTTSRSQSSIYWHGGNGTMQNCNLEKSNFLLAYNLNSEYVSTFKIENSNFFNSKVSLSGPNITIYKSNFTNSSEISIYSGDGNSENAIILLSNFCNNTYLDIKNARNFSISYSNFYNFSGANCGVLGKLTNCNFENCTSAIRWGGIGGNITDCKFINCSTNNGNLIHLSGGNGTIKNCEFINTTGHHIIRNEDNLNINDCNFTGNSVDYIIYNIKNPFLDNRRLILNNNFVDEGIFVYNMGRISSPTLFVVESKTINYGEMINTTGYLYDLTGRNKYNLIVDSGKEIGSTLQSSENFPIILKVGNESNTGKLINDHISFTNVDTSKLSVGSYLFNSNLNSRYTDLVHEGKLIINKANVNLIIQNIENLKYGDNVSSVTVVSNLSTLEPITLVFYKGGVEYVKDIFDAGSYNVVATLENNNYNNNVVSKKFTVNKYPINIVSDGLTSIYKMNNYFKIQAFDSDNLEVNGVDLIIDIYRGEDIFKTVNLNTDSNGIAKYDVSDLPIGDYNVVIRISNENYDGGKTSFIQINKIPTKLTSPIVTATYGVNKYLTITLKDASGNLLANKKVTVKVGSISKNVTTNSNGQVSVLISKLIPKTYVASIIFAGDDYYDKSSTTASVVVKKATPKLTAKAKTFRRSVKTKKYSITLKNNKGKVMKNTKVTLRVNKKTYSVRTNSKGVATFKITNLKKKGKFRAVVKYAGSKYYNKVTKKPIITIKA